MTTVVVTAGVLAAAEPSGAGSLALLIVTLLALATLLLYRSMKKQLGKVPKSFDRPDDPTARDP